MLVATTSTPRYRSSGKRSLLSGVALHSCRSVTTLDALIGEYGEPCFIKIDIEGYEAEVLAGRSRSVQALVFEFQNALPDVREACLRRLRDKGATRSMLTIRAAKRGILSQATAAHSRGAVNSKASRNSWRTARLSVLARAASRHARACERQAAHGRGPH
jgi:hypothetical protein